MRHAVWIADAHGHGRRRGRFDAGVGRADHAHSRRTALARGRRVAGLRPDPRPGHPRPEPAPGIERTGAGARRLAHALRLRPRAARLARRVARARGARRPPARAEAVARRAGARDRRRADGLRGGRDARLFRDVPQGRPADLLAVRAVEPALLVVADPERRGRAAPRGAGPRPLRRLRGDLARRLVVSARLRVDASGELRARPAAGRRLPRVVGAAPGRSPRAPHHGARHLDLRPPRRRRPAHAPAAAEARAPGDEAAPRARRRDLPGREPRRVAVRPVERAGEHPGAGRVPRARSGAADLVRARDGGGQHDQRLAPEPPDGARARRPARRLRASAAALALRSRTATAPR